jgi:hypothetical protein
MVGRSTATSGDHKMDSTTTSVWSTLSFDVLAHIFSHYATTETVDHPIETLLLVSRWWRDVALGHRALWSHLNAHIDIGSLYYSPRIWKSRLPLRLKRCGDTLPLHVDLRHLPSSFARGAGHPQLWEKMHRQNRPFTCPVRANGTQLTQCTCITDALLCVDELFLLLAGQGGILCKRWKSLNLEVRDPMDYSLKYREVAPVLRYPMPLLSSLAIHNLTSGNFELALPYASARRSPLRIATNVLLPSLQPVRSLTMVVTRQELIGGKFTYLIAEEARNVEELSLDGDFMLPNCMTKLWRLETAGAIRWSGDGEAQLPSLTHLSLKNRPINYNEKPIQIQSVDLLRLVSLGVHWDPDYNHSSFKGIILEILQAAKNLSIIHGNQRGVGMVLKLVWEHEMRCVDLRKRGKDEPRLLAGQRISITVHQSSAVLQGDETCLQLCNVARLLKVDAPNASWNILLW